ncbi:ribonuclease HII [Desulfopila sp. IMCC35008]|uniref:ribonuclease HII n=1 Tax=Desulfopila sp. IMCC35008 TaxID=2653858 RepID=UPI0013D120A6|nr:ribonuclease HII [Desulfopila sp. IMCC35008]
MSRISLPHSTTDIHDRFQYERFLYKQGFSAIAGSDEVGRGPLAGPVVAASVILPAECDRSPFLDSKQLSHTRLVLAYDYLHELGCPVGIGVVSTETIERINILQASLLAMKRSINDLERQGHRPDYILVDGKFEIPLSLPQQALIKGESKSSSIAAASIAAKVTRDRIMVEMDKKFPLYNFAQHKGYPTKAHKQAVREFGPCKIHRKTFKGVKEFVTKSS